MPHKPAQLKCPKCGDLPNVLADACLKCGTRLEKICGECGFANSAEKGYCDQCGTQLALPQPGGQAQQAAASPKLELESIQDTVNQKATSFRGKAAPGAQPAAQQQPRQPGKPPARTDTGTSALIADSARLRRDTLPRKVVTSQKALLKKLAGPAIIAGMLCALLVILYLIVAPSLPRLRLMMTAKSYLTYISETKYDKAYDLLSANSKAACSREDYIKNSSDYYSKAPAWQFKNIEVLSMSKEAAMIRYKLKEGSADWKDDYISFVREHDRWTRPYIWIFFHPIDEAIKKGDYSQALFLAQKLYLTDPVDPRSSGYLCSTEFFMRLWEKSVESCKRTIDGAAAYPVGYTNDELYWFNLAYADSLRYLQRDLVAIQEYEKLMKWPGLTPQEQCPLFLNIADSYVNTKDYDRALRSLMAAQGVCTENPSKDDVTKHLAYMSGSAMNDAITFAQRSHFQAGMPPIAEARRLQLEALKARLGPRNAKFLPKDNWMAVHVGGPEYRVFLRQEMVNPRTRKAETKDVFIFLVNLWTGKAKVEKAPPPPPPPGAPPKAPAPAEED
jgi:ribosomal protein S27E